MGVGQELAAIAEQAAAGHTELNAGTAVHHLHIHQDGLAGTQSGHDVALIDLGHVDDNALHRLHDLAVLLVSQNVRGADLQLIAFAAHRLDQDGQMHLAAAHDAEGIVGGGILDLQGDILQQLAHQAVTDLAGGDVLALLAGERGIVDREGHLDRGVVDLDEGQGLHLAGVADGVADGDIGQTCEGDDIARLGALDRLTAIGLEVEQLGDAAAHMHIGVVPVADLDGAADLDNAVLHAANAHAADEIVIVNAGNQHLQRLVRLALRRLHIFQDGVKQGLEVRAGGRIGPVIAGRAVTAGAEDHRAVQLLVGSTQVHQQLQNLVDDFRNAGVGAVDLVDRDDERQVLLQSLLQNKAGLGHAALGCIDQQQNAVDHLQNALDLAAEVRVARGVDDVDLNAVVLAGAVLGKDRDAALAFDIAGVHDALGDLLVRTESTGLLQHLVDQRRFAVVNVRNDCNVAEIFLNHIRSLSN